jgi:hypothetical protein
MLMEQLDYNLLFRWFVGLNMDDPIWDVTVFTKNRERLLDGDIANAFFQAVLEQNNALPAPATRSRASRYPRLLQVGDFGCFRRVAFVPQ